MFANRVFHKKIGKSDKWTHPTYNSGRENGYIFRGRNSAIFIFASLTLNQLFTGGLFHCYMLEKDSVSYAKYLGVTISDDLSWSTHTDNITKSANQTIGFLKINIWVHYKDLKSVAYKTLVRLQLEYASTVWSPTVPLI